MYIKVHSRKTASTTAANSAYSCASVVVYTSVLLSPSAHLFFVYKQRRGKLEGLKPNIRYLSTLYFITQLRVNIINVLNLDLG